MLRKSKYLLKTRCFPHSPQVFPQEFSTVPGRLGKIVEIDIKISDRIRPNSHFFAGCVFYHREFFVQKFLLDKGKCVEVFRMRN